MNRRYSYSRLSPSTVEHYSCTYNQSSDQNSCSDLGPGLATGIPSDLYRQQPLYAETIHMPLYELVKPEDKDVESSVTADKLKPSGGCCGGSL